MTLKTDQTLRYFSTVALAGCRSNDMKLLFAKKKTHIADNCIPMIYWAIKSLSDLYKYL